MTFEPPASSSATALASLHETSGYRPLDPRSLRLWQVTDGIAWGVVLVIAVSGGATMAFYNSRALPWVIAVWLCIPAVAAWNIFYFHSRNYHAWGYHLDGRVLLIRSGVWFRTIKLLPLSRLQHVDVKRGPLQRRFGLATLVLHTAGTQAASIEVPGLDADEAMCLRDHLVAAGGDDGV